MKKLFLSFSLALLCFPAFAQPSLVGTVTGGNEKVQSQGFNDKQPLMDITDGARSFDTNEGGAGKLIPGQYIVVFKDEGAVMALGALPYKQRQVEMRSIAHLTLEQNNLAAKNISAVYSTAIRGFSVSGLSESEAELLRIDTRVDLIEQDQVFTLEFYSDEKQFPGVKSKLKKDTSNLHHYSPLAQNVPWGITRVGGGLSGAGKRAWILDSGIDLTHPDLNVNTNLAYFYPAPDFDMTSPQDGLGHGTHVAGTVAAIDNDFGVIGVAAGAEVVPVKIFTDFGYTETSWLIAGIDYIASNAAPDDVVNMSLGGPGTVALDNAIISASSVCPFVLAAGNSSIDANSVSPARVNGPNVYTISAMDINDNFALFSNYGNPPVDYCEPGVDVLSCAIGGGYVLADGTSMAAPHFSGLLLIGDICFGGFVNNDTDLQPDPIGVHGLSQLVDNDNDGFPVCEDCDDNNGAVFPGAPEICDGLDNDCDGLIDNGTACCTGSNILYVKQDANGNNDGSSWENAFTDLQHALMSDCPGIDQIWVAAGIYKPTQGTNPLISFSMKNNLAIYGGFDGTETNLSERDWENNITILSGDLLENDGPDFANWEDNSATVVNINDIDNTAILDGFTISGGGFSIYSGGMNIFNSSPTLSNLIITNNWGYTGGGMFVRSGTPVLTNCTFFANKSTYGGGAYFEDGSLTMTKCTFKENRAISSGAFTSSECILDVSNSVFEGNYAAYVDDPSYARCGGITISGGNAKFENCIFNNNKNFGTVPSGGHFDVIYADLSIINCVIANASSANGGGAFFVTDECNINIDNTIFYNNIASSGNFYFEYPALQSTILTNCITDEIAGEGLIYNSCIISSDPQFTDPGNDDFTLTACSPAIDHGTSIGAPTADFNGLARVNALPGDGIVDIGAFEFQSVFSDGTHWFVNSSATPNGNGGSWDCAFTNLQDALSVASDGEKIWVAAGTYYPTSGTDRNTTFQLKNNLAIYGGFDGTEDPLTFDLNDRDFVANETILSGNIGDQGTNTDNIYTVVNATGTDNTALLDGFTIAQGYSPFTSEDPASSGGGMFIGDNSSPVIANCSFVDNYAATGGAVFSYATSDPTATTPGFFNCAFTNNAGSNGGGGIYNKNCNPTISGCTFTGNYATAFGWGGGAILNYSSSPVIENCVFTGNSSGFAQGGAISNWDGSTPSISNCLILDNSSLVYGGGIYITGNSMATVTNCTFSGNSSNNGGSAITVETNSSATVSNCTFSGNVSNTGAGAIIVSSSTATISNAILWGNEDTEISAPGSSVNVSNSIVKQVSGIYPGTGNKNEDPLFVDPDNDNFRLQACSPAINTGDNTAVPAGITTDLDGNPRIYDNGIVDMGAYEYQGTAFSGPVVFVKNNATGVNNGLSWDDAFTSLQDALNSSCPGVNQIWVAAGTYYPDEGDGYTDNDRTHSFVMKNNLAIYGGFAGTEDPLTFDLADRDFVNNVSVLSGDIGTPDDNSDNSYQIVANNDNGLNNSAVLDGFTITGGNADGNNPYKQGGGMYNAFVEPTIRNCIFSGNSADDSGGGLYLDGGKETIVNCIISGNSAANDGGGLYIVDSEANIINCSFSGNSAANDGGGLYNNSSTPEIENTLIWNNKDQSGTGTANASIFNSSSNPSVIYSLVQGQNPGGVGNLDGTDASNDPLFIAGINPNLAPTTYGNLHLQPCSPVINAGNNNSVPAGITTDLDGNPRIYNNVTVEMGAYEYQGKPVAGSIIYVNDNASGNNDGSSWTDAITNLQDALSLATLCSNVSEIWVAAGTYHPDEGDSYTLGNRLHAFVLQNNLAIYGGFAGTEDPLTFDLADRDFVNNVSVLSGDIGTSGDNSDNSYQVVANDNRGAGNSAILDGFTITGGNANGTDPYDRGGGMFCKWDGPSIVNCVFVENLASNSGGAMYLTPSSYLSDDIIITNCSFAENSAGGSGGGIYKNGDDAIITNCSFSGNSAGGSGGGIYTDDGAVEIINCNFLGNSSGGSGGGFSAYDAPFIEIINCTFSGNLAANNGGGIYNDDSFVILSNTVVWNNKDNSGTGTANASFFNINSSPLIVFCLVQGQYLSGSNNLDGTDPANDPLFITPVDPANAPTITGDLHLQSCSPVINVGLNNQNPTSTDLDGNPRFYNNGTIDLGAYEYQGEFAPCCPEPSDLMASAITATTADLGWTENGDATSWQIRLGLFGFDTTGATPVVTASNPYPATGLDPDAGYDFYVRAVCDGSGFSDWVGPYTFTTGCAPPTAVCQNITVYLDGTGNASITAADIDGGSTAPCGLASMSASQTSFTCADLGPNNVTLTVTDINNDTDDCVAVVTIADNITPNPGTISGNTEIAFGSSTGDLILSGNYGDVKKWQKRFGTSGIWTDIAHTGTIYSEIPASSGVWQYRVLVQGSTCVEAFTDPHSVTVGTKELTIGGSFTANDKIYDDNTDATFGQNNLNLVGVVGSDDVTLNGLEIDFEFKDVGNHTVTITNAELAGTDKDNYTLTLAGSPTTTASINPGAPAKFLVTDPDGNDISSPKLANIPFDAKVTLVDAFDNPTPNSGGDVSVTLTGTGGTTPGDLRFQGFPSDPVTQTLAADESSIDFNNILYTGVSSIAGFDVKIDAVASGTGSADDKTGESNLFSVRGIFFTVEADPTTLPADGASKSDITVTLLDNQNNPLANQEITLETDFGTLMEGTTELTGVVSRTTDANGQVLLQLRADNESALATVTAKCPGACPHSVEVAFTLNAPEITGFTPGENQAGVEFNPPTNPGSTTITNYEYSLNDGNDWNPFNPEQDASPVNVSGLTEYQTYPLKLRAINEAGTGAASESFEIYACANPTSGGAIEANQNLFEGDTPALLTNEAEATGQFGDLEYKWQSSTTSANDDFTDIPGATDATYQPEATFETTWFRRLAKVTCKSDWAGAAQSNVVQVYIYQPPTVEITSPADGSTTYEATITVSGTASDPDNDLASVYVRINGGGWQPATGTENWQADLPVVFGNNLIEAKSVDAQGLESPVNHVTILAGVQEIAFGEGWNHISAYLTPLDATLETILQGPVNENLITLLNDMHGGIYWPSQNLNTIGQWNDQEAYQAKLTGASTILFSGDMLDDQTLGLESGYAYLPVLTNVSSPIDEVFENPMEDVKLIFNHQTVQVYWPYGGIFTLQELQPGMGYLALLNNPATATFPPYDLDALQTKSTGITLPAEGPWPLVRTNKVHMISVNNGAMAELPAGTFIGAFDENGICIGHTEKDTSDENNLLVVYGDEGYTQPKDGALEGEAIYFRAWSAATGEENDLTPVYSNRMPNSDGLFENNGLSMITDFKVSSTGIGNQALVSQIEIYPNPATDEFTISLNGVETKPDGIVLLTDSKGNLVKQIRLTGETTTMDVSDLPPGLFFVQVPTTHGPVMEKLIIR